MLHGNGAGWLTRLMAQSAAVNEGAASCPSFKGTATGQLVESHEPHGYSSVLQLQCADLDACGWRWLARKPAAAGLGHEAGSARGDDLMQAREAAAWREVATTRVYTPAEGDLGGWLRVECTPVARHAAFLLAPILHTFLWLV